MQLIPPHTKNRVTNIANAAAPTATEGLGKLFEWLDANSGSQSRLIDGKWINTGSTFTTLKNLALKPGLKAVGYAGLAYSVYDNNPRPNEYLEGVTYNFGEAMIRGSNINIVNQGLFDVRDESATVESVESRLNVIHTGVSLALSKYDLSTKNGRRKANKFLKDKDNRRILMHFINLLLKQHNKESDEYENN